MHDFSDKNSNHPPADDDYMKEAIKEAKKAMKRNEVPIGCVIVRDGEIIAKAYNRRILDASTLSHAEILAIKKACRKMGDWRLEGCTMYITLEPCPMCAGAILQARMDRIVIGSLNPKAGSAGSVINLLDMEGFNHRVQIDRPGEEIITACSTLLQDFFRLLRKKTAEKKNRQKEEASS